MDGIDFEDSTVFYDEIKKVWPETRAEGVNRMKNFSNSLIEDYKQSDKKVAHIFVTHGFFVAEWGELFNGSTAFLKYCSISGI